MKSKLNWSEEEELELKNAVESGKYETWAQIANFMNQKFPHRICHGRQYRERYMNHSKFGENKTLYFSWNSLEEDTLFQLYEDYGPKWSYFSSSFPRKSETCLKNKFYGSIRKTVRKLNQIGLKAQRKINKTIKYEAVIRILDAAENAFDLPSEIKKESNDLRELVLKISLKWEDDFTEHRAMDLIQRIFKFNTATRCYNGKKWKRASKRKDDAPSSIHHPSDPSQQNQKDQEIAPTLQTIPLEIKVDQGEQKNRETGSGGHGISIHKEYMMADQVQEAFLNIEARYQDLMYDVCAILKEKYVPESFYYFE